MSMIGFPLLLIPLAIVNIVVFLMPGTALDAPIYTLALPSTTAWTFTFSDVLVAFGMLMLFFEVTKAARPGAKYFTDHLLSFIVFAGAAAEFTMLPQFGNSTFFLLTLLAFVDVIAGISIRAVRPKPVAARAAPVPAEYERPVSKPVAAEPAIAPAPQPASPIFPEAPAAQAQPNEAQPAEQRDVPIAPHQDILPPEPTAPRR